MFFKILKKKNVLQFLRFLLEFIELLLTVALYFLMLNYKILLPRGLLKKSGFVCNDISLQYPYYHNTVKYSFLKKIGLYLPMATIITIELFYYIAIKFQRITKIATKTLHAELQLLLQIYHAISTFYMGNILICLLLKICKAITRRLRPYFLTICKPMLPDNSTCADAINQGRYILEYTCLGNRSRLRQAYRSFPSGHAAVGFYGMMFLALYLQRNFRGRISWVIRPVLQVFCFLFAAIVAISRYVDRKHNTTDILTGSILGIAMAMLMFFSRYWKSRGEQEYATVSQDDSKSNCSNSKSITA